MRERRKKRPVGLLIFLCLVLILGVLAYGQRNNIAAVIGFMQYSKSEIEEQLSQNEDKIQDTLNSLPEVTVRPVTEEEREALKDGSLTHEELADILVKPKPPAEPVEEPVVKPVEPSIPAEPDPDLTREQYEKELSALVAQIYVLREEYTIALDDLLEEAKADYSALPSSKRKPSDLAGLVSSYLDRGNALEKECDRKMDALLTKLETLLKENGGDMSVSQTVYDTYVNEKSMKKAWYMAKLKEKGLI